jgi:serine protease inhibitor
MKNWNLFLILSVLCMGTLSCTRDFSTVPSTAPDREFTEIEKALVQSSNTFGFRLFRQVDLEEGGKNLFLSPLSVSMALGMTLNGAAGGTETDMRRTLGFGDMDRDSVNATYKNILDLLPGLDPKTLIEIANSIWYRQGFPVLPEFVDVSRLFFDAAVQGLDFSSPQAPGVINGWIEDKTHGKITRMIEEIDPAAVMFLINAVYFKGTWKYEFDPKSTSDDVFNRADGSTIPCKMMGQKATLGYYETETFQAADLPYGNGRYAMSILLPKAGQSIETLIASFDPAAWSLIKNGFTEREITLHIPKFKLEYEIELNDALSAMGMAVAFQGGLADFSRIAEGRDLYIHLVKHKTFVEVDEKGTEAAAVTVVEIRETSAGPGNEILMRVDRPFLIVIREKSSDALLFMGKITAPAL